MCAHVDLDRAAKAKVGCVLGFRCLLGVIGHRAGERVVPRHEAVALGIGPQVLLAQEVSVVAAHQQRGIGPRAHETFVEARVRDQQVDQPQRQCRIGSGPHGQPGVSLPRERRGARIDHHHLRPVRAASTDRVGLRQPGVRWVVPPQHDQFGLRVVGRRHPAAEGEGVREVLVPVADLGRVADVGAAEEAHEALDPIDAVRQWRAAGCGHSEHHRLGTALGLDGTQALGGLGQCLVPADAHPARIRFGLGPRATHRVAQPVRTVHQFGRGLALHAHRLAGGVRSVGPHRHQHVVTHLVERAAARTAERAVALLGLRGRRRRHHLHPESARLKASPARHSSACARRPRA
ncbi:hypothetical protein FQZ97_677740 [compost metagenome]